MKPDAAGPISNAQDRLVQCFQASAEFNLFMETDVPGALPAADRIHTNKIAMLPDGTETTIVQQLEQNRPFITIWRDPDNALSIESHASGAARCGGMLCVYGQSATANAVKRYPTIDITSEEEVTAWWNNMIGVMVYEAFVAGHDTILPLRRVPAVVVWRNHPARRAHYGDYHAFFCKFQWGVGR